MPELRPNPVPLGVYLPKAVSDYFSTIRPIDMTAGDLELRFRARPGSWKPTSSHGLMSHGNTGDLSWRFLVSTNGFLQLYISTNGTSETLYASDVAIPNVSGVNEVRVVRSASTGNITFYTSRNEGQSWQQLGSVIASEAAPPHLSAADIKVGIAPPGSASFRGHVRSADVRVDGVSVCNLDLTRAWENAKGPWVDTHGNEWVLNGDNALWQVDRSGMSRRVQPMDLANMFGWSSDFAGALSGGTAPPAGTVVCVRVFIPEDCLVTNINAYIIGGGTGVTASQNWFGLYRLDGTQVAVTAALSLADLSTGNKIFPVVAPVEVPAGIYLVKMLLNASTSPPSFAVSGSSAAVNAGGSTTKGWRVFTEDTGQTSFPATPAAGPTRHDVGYLLGVS